MKDYSAMSDFEISRLVGDKKGIEWANLDENYHPLCSWIDGGIAIFDPCNSWADAGPIIAEKKISIHAPRFSEGWLTEYAGSDDDVNDGFSVDYFEYHHQNPLRAAMIVFLMMKDAE